MTSPTRGTTRMRRAAVALATALAGATGLLAVAAAAPGPGPDRPLVGGYPVLGTQDAKGEVTRTPLGRDGERVRVRYGPIRIIPGANINAFAPSVPGLPDGGHVTRFAYDLRYADGRVPGVDVLHLHHAVWFAGDVIFPGGEEKTVFSLPRGFGWRVPGGVPWQLNHMIHNLTAAPVDVYLLWEADVVREGTPASASLRDARSLFLDVRGGEAYPVFDVKRGSGRGGRITYPDGDPAAYGAGPALNRVTVPADGTLVAAVGHIHPGGLWADLRVTRGGRTVPVFRSAARYWEPAGPVSWDMAMTHTRPGWRVRVRRGDVLSVAATYETRRASWYEAMGIITAAFAPGAGDGPDPFTAPVRTDGVVTHGRLPENRRHGGEPRPGLTDPRRRASGPRTTEVPIRGFAVTRGNLLSTGPGGAVPVVPRGTPLTFVNEDSSLDVFHTVTSCKEPCTQRTGVAFPLADGRVDFDSGELGFGPEETTAAANRDRWSTPRTLPPGTYSFFCRIHPFMRGAFRVAP